MRRSAGEDRDPCGSVATRESDAYEVMERSMLLTVRERGAAARQAVQQRD
jgi:hypothetical protein